MAEQMLMSNYFYGFLMKFEEVRKMSKLRTYAILLAGRKLYEDSTVQTWSEIYEDMSSTPQVRKREKILRCGPLSFSNIDVGLIITSNMPLIAPRARLLINYAGK